jgi:4-alpha-glucanotransferase
MRLTFQIRFATRYGQSLWLTGNHEIFGNGDVAAAIPLEFINDQFWRVTIIIPKSAIPDALISYSYVLREADGTLVQDWGRDREVNFARIAAETVLIIDSWNSLSNPQNTFYTEPFQEVLLKANHTEVLHQSPDRVTHVFKVKAPLLSKGETLCVLGSTPGLGNWNTYQLILLNRKPGSDFLWTELDLTLESFPISYKYGVYNLERKAFVQYEEGPNRALEDSSAYAKHTIVNDGFAALNSALWKGAGVAIPVFSLRSEASFGVGEFTDLKRMADWCERAGLKLIQILPVNDTTATHTWQDSYPYSGISAFALHPLYLNLSQVASGANKSLLKNLESERQRLNALDALDYAAVMAAKMAFLKQIYPSEKDRTFKTAQYQSFFERNKPWLVPYAAFSCLRDKYGTVDFTQWPEFGKYKAEEITMLANEDSAAYAEMAFHYFLQFHLHLQLREATEYAHTKGVVLKGDIPIGVARFGVDAWQEPDLYQMDMQAGAPPDAFSAKGQNWSFPTYNWPRMQQNGFAWWKQRFAQMADYFDAFRIDHILGFFRIWSIPTHAVEGILGYFVRAIPVRAAEFASRGIHLELARCLKPHITDSLLLEIFGSDQETVKQQFLNRNTAGSYDLKDEFRTQRNVEKHFAALEATQRNKKLMQGLFDLISNVILLKEEGTDDERFHFRLGIESTPSFQSLDLETQARLRDLYIDYFYRRQDAFWMKEALKKLPALKRVTNMLVCGEDLGMVPACVPIVMRDLGLLGLEVQRMPKRLNQEFSRPGDAPYLSVVTPSTHDMSTIRGWWKEDRNIIQRFFNQELGERNEAPLECEPWINKAIVLQHLASPAMLAIFQLQDLLGTDEQLRRKNPEEERINVPANPKNYWRYRMHLTLEQLASADAFNSELKARIQENGR